MGTQIIIMCLKFQATFCFVVAVSAALLYSAKAIVDVSDDVITDDVEEASLAPTDPFKCQQEYMSEIQEAYAVSETYLREKETKYGMTTDELVERYQKRKDEEIRQKMFARGLFYREKILELKGTSEKALPKITLTADGHRKLFGRAFISLTDDNRLAISDDIKKNKKPGGHVVVAINDRLIMFLWVTDDLTIEKQNSTLQIKIKKTKKKKDLTSKTSKKSKSRKGSRRSTDKSAFTTDTKFTILLSETQILRLSTESLKDGWAECDGPCRIRIRIPVEAQPHPTHKSAPQIVFDFPFRVSLLTVSNWKQINKTPTYNNILYQTTGTLYDTSKCVIPNFFTEEHGSASAAYPAFRAKNDADPEFFAAAYTEREFRAKNDADREFRAKNALDCWIDSYPDDVIIKTHYNPYMSTFRVKSKKMTAPWKKSKGFTYYDLPPNYDEEDLTKLDIQDKKMDEFYRWRTKLH